MIAAQLAREPPLHSGIFVPGGLTSNNKRNNDEQISFNALEKQSGRELCGSSQENKKRTAT
ncbi:MAG: hypothetical protein V1794_15985 [Candidatus Glassbacteria bacterium]